jgi:protein-L-isoaspartate(D-aspartate) O-methyltransferase
MESRKLFRSKIQLLFTLIYNGYLRDIRLVKAFLDVPLKKFIPNELFSHFKIYTDAPVLFYLNKENPETLRTISAPHMISIMLQQLLLEDDDNLLILGAKSGYIAALAHKLAPKGKIVILEANQEIAKITQDNLERNGLQDKVKVIVDNPLNGQPELAPWQKILVTGAIKQERIIPLLLQLDSSDGVLFAPVGENLIQDYTQIIRIGNEFYGKKHLRVRFTPLITQIELDELKLVTEITEINTQDAVLEHQLSIGNILINYSSDILDEVRLEPFSKSQTHEINAENVFLVALEFIDQTIDSLSENENLTYWTNSIDNIKIILETLQRIKTNRDDATEYFMNNINQIKSYNLIRKELERGKRSETTPLKREIDVIGKQMRDVKILQKNIKEEIKKIKKK